MEKLNVLMLQMSSIVVSDDESVDLIYSTFPYASLLAANTTNESLDSSSIITITNTTTSILTTVAAAIDNETNTNVSVIGEEVERADIPEETTEAPEPTLPAIIAVDRETEAGALFNKHNACSAQS